MSFYERIDKQKIAIPSRFDMSIRQLDDIKKSSPGLFEMIGIAFKFGYMQGVRAAKVGKAESAV